MQVQVYVARSMAIADDGLLERIAEVEAYSTATKGMQKASLPPLLEASLGLSMLGDSRLANWFASARS